MKRVSRFAFSPQKDHNPEISASAGRQMRCEGSATSVMFEAITWKAFPSYGVVIADVMVKSREDRKKKRWIFSASVASLPTQCHAISSFGQ